MLDPTVGRVREKYGLSERHACRLVGQTRGTQRYTTIARADEDGLTRAIIALAPEPGNENAWQQSGARPSRHFRALDLEREKRGRDRTLHREPRLVHLEPWHPQ